MSVELSTSKPRERIIQTASNLFYNHGYRAIGIDRIINESGVAKMTFYKHFPSKDDLIAEYLHTATDQFWTWMDAVTAKHKTPRKQLEAMFESIAKVASSPQCMGCAFTHAAAEFPDANHLGHIAALEYKNGVLAKLEELARAARAKNPQGLARDLMMVMDGAWAAARMYGAGNHASRAGETARVLIAAQCKS
jgi:AcrR family transcriptional regulator